MTTYEVTVGNLGTAYRGNSKKDAQAEFKYWVSQSQLPRGRVSGEDVTYWEDNEPLIEFEGGRLKSFQTREEAKQRDPVKSSRKARVQRSKKLPSASVYQVQVYDHNEDAWYPHSEHSTKRAAETALERSYAFQGSSSMRIVRKAL